MRIRNRAGRTVRHGHSVETIRHVAAKNTAKLTRPVSANSQNWLIDGEA
jgi:hypothetical protein